MRVTYAKLWLKNYADDAFIFTLQENLPQKATELRDEQKRALALFADAIEKSETVDGQALHELTHSIKEASGLDAKEFFSAIYIVFLGKESGPKVGWFLSTLTKEFVLKRLREIK